MTRKDYVKFAAMFRSMLADCGNHASTAGVTETCERTANLFQADNPNFDRERFLKACGVGS